MPKIWYVYVLKCSDGSFYTGLTANLRRRMWQHQDGVFNNYTKSRRPIKLVYWEKFTDKYKAALREKEIKDWRREKKQSLIDKFISDSSQ